MLHLLGLPANNDKWEPFFNWRFELTGPVGSAAASAAAVRAACAARNGDCRMPGHNAAEKIRTWQPGHTQHTELLHQPKKAIAHMRSPILTRHAETRAAAFQLPMQLPGVGS